MNKVKLKKISEINAKRSKILINIDEQLEKVGNQFGESFMDELYRRLELVVMHFQLEFEEAMKNSFERHNVIKENFDLLTGRSISEVDSQKNNGRIPSFILEHEKIKKKNFAS